MWTKDFEANYFLYLIWIISGVPGGWLTACAVTLLHNSGIAVGGGGKEKRSRFIHVLLHECSETQEQAQDVAQ